MKPLFYLLKMTSLCCGVLVASSTLLMAAERTIISSAAEWQAHLTAESAKQADEQGIISGEGKFVITSQRIDLGAPQQLEQVRIRQSPAWHNWQPIEIGPKKKGAPILLPVADQQYWLFCGGHRYKAFFRAI